MHFLSPFICLMAAFFSTCNNEVVIFRLQTDDQVKTVAVAGEFNGWSTDADPMHRGADGVWITTLELPLGRYLYKFVVDGEHWITDPQNQHREADGYGGENSVLLCGITEEESELILSHDRYELDVPTDTEFSTPQWAKEATWYQIMVDRFRNGNPNSDPDPVRPWTSEWYTQSDFEGKDGQTFYNYFVFSRLYGGDFQGVISKLDYLHDLGVTAIYLNPVFQSESHHKYNTTNFLHIDERYGGGLDYQETQNRESLKDPSTWIFNDSDRVFLEFLKEAHSRGFKVIIDGVFNHVGTRHPAFQDVKQHGDVSEFAKWFEVHSWEPFEYACWAGFGELPSFRKVGDGLHPEVEAHLFAMTRRWMDPNGDGDPSDGIDGWRLDVPNEIAPGFWKRWRTLVKGINPEAYISGEIWSNASAWLRGDTFDAVMNYQFAQTVLRWVGDQKRKLTATEMAVTLAQLRNHYPPQATYALQNLLDSHDTDRVVSKLYNPDRAYDSGNREQDDFTYDGSKPPKVFYQRARLLALLQATYVGAPMIYYGDEVGMWGSDDPTNRKPMLWKDLEPYESPEENAVDDEHLVYFQTVFNMRKQYAALRCGSIETVFADDEADVWMFIREYEGETMLIALNASEHDATVELPEGEWVTIFSTSDTKNLDVSGVGGRVWIKK